MDRGRQHVLDSTGPKLEDNLGLARLVLDRPCQLVRSFDIGWRAKDCLGPAWSANDARRLVQQRIEINAELGEYESRVFEVVHVDRACAGCRMQQAHIVRRVALPIELGGLRR